MGLSLSDNIRLLFCGSVFNNCKNQTREWNGDQKPNPGINYGMLLFGLIVENIKVLVHPNLASIKNTQNVHIFYTCF